MSTWTTQRCEYCGGEHTGSLMDVIAAYQACIEAHTSCVPPA